MASENDTYYRRLNFEQMRHEQLKRGCPRCGSTCGVDGCRICLGKDLCSHCAHKIRF